ncbi:MAG TPA: HyaD/HybD family hydrogenase maturation endopeptidase [Deferrisomatales bacterium]|nr:HyaD/HybD family hydrogenase maturation endopeptidase [Deferrisomatales bacterium]
MTDDAVGLEALIAFQDSYRVPDGVDLLDGGTLGLDLLPRMEGYRNILIADCVTVGHPPGTLLQVDGEDVRTTFSRCLSPHQMGLKDLIAVLELQGRLPERLTVLGVEPESIELGEQLSATVSATLPRLVEAMARVLGEWGLPPGTH